MDKEYVRQEVKQKKASMKPDDIGYKSEQIKKYLFELPEYKDAKSIYCYVAFNQEVRTADIINEALLAGKRVYVPKVFGEVMKFIEIRSLSGLEPGVLGILEPQVNEEVIPELNSLFIVPGLAFDKDGGRIGYGKGYYDKYFSSYGEDKFIKVALTYEFQIYEKLQEFPSDVKMDMIITENGLYNLANKRHY